MRTLTAAERAAVAALRSGHLTLISPMKSAILKRAGEVLSTPPATLTMSDVGASSMATGKDIPFGLCACGCGNSAPIAKRNRTSPIQTMVKGQPQKWIAGHHKRALSLRLVGRTEKPCSRCREVKPLTDFYAAKKPGGRGHYCKPCWGFIVTEQHRKHPEKKPTSDRRYYSEHRDKIIAQTAKWQSENRGRVRARATERRKDKGLRDRANARSALWAKKNPEKMRAWRRRYLQTHRASINERTKVRRRRNRLAPGRGITRNQWRALIADSLGLCSYCNGPCKPTLDHIDPIARGGEHDIDNATIVCQSCNASKGESSLLVWLAWRATRRAA